MSHLEEPLLEKTRSQDAAADIGDAADAAGVTVTFDTLPPVEQEKIIAKINTEIKTETTKGKTATFKDYISDLENDKLHCFITRNGESALNATAVTVASFFGVGLWELMELVKRVCNIRYLNYLYKFVKNDESFFITFKKRIEKGGKDEFSDFGITLSKHVDNPEDCKSVALQYIPGNSGNPAKIVNGTVDVLGNLNGIKEVSLKNEYKSDVLNRSTHVNMIVLRKLCGPVGKTLKIDIDSAIDLIREIDYDQFLDNVTLTPSGADVGVGGGLPPENTGSTRKNKYMYRITSRKRRLYRKKSRKGKNAYKKLRSRKIARK